MMKITKLSLIGAISALTVVGGTVGLIYGLGDRSDKNYSETFINQKNIYRNYINNETGRASEPTIYQFNIDSNIQSYDTSNLASNYIQMSLPLMRLTRPYENRTIFTNDGNVEKEGTDLIRFEAADKIIIKYKDNEGEKKVEFSQENINDKEKGIINYFKELPSVEEYSLISVAFTIRENVYWVDSSGEKTNYKLKAEDYYYGLKSALLRDSLKLRLANGANASYEKGKDLINGKKNNWNDSGNYYLFNVFGADIKYNNIPLDNFPVEENTNKELFKISANSDNKNTPFFFLNKLMFGMRMFLPSPSEYIKETLKKEEKKEITLHNSGEKDVKKLGIYWYGRSLDYDYPIKTSEFIGKYGSKSPTRTLFVGPYVPGYEDDLRTEIIKNRNYWDQEWVKSEKTIEKYVTYYQKVDKEQFKKAQIQRYKLGYILSSNLDLMTEIEKKSVLDDPEKYGFDWNRQNRFQGNIGQITRAGFPTDTLLANLNNDGNFNIEALNLVYGTKVTKDEVEKIIKEKTIKPTDKDDGYNPTLLDLLPENTQIPTDQNNSFLNALFATVNWENIIKNIEGFEKIYWSNLIPPTIGFPDKDKFIDLEESSSYYIKYKDTTVSFSSADNKNVTNISEAENVKSAKYDDVVKLINEIIKDALNDGRIQKDSIIKFNIPYRFVNASKKHDTIMKKVENIINSIRIENGIKIQFKYEKPVDLNNLLSLITLDSNIFSFGGWGNDYNSYSTFLAYYFLYNDGLYKILDDDESVFAKFLKDDATLKSILSIIKDINDSNKWFSRLFYNSLNGHGAILKDKKLKKDSITEYEDSFSAQLTNITDLLNYFHFIYLLEKDKKDKIIEKLKVMKFDGSDDYKINDIFISPDKELEDDSEKNKSDYYKYWLSNFENTIASNIILELSLKFEKESFDDNKDIINYLKNTFGGSVDIAQNIISDLSKAIKTIKKSYLYDEKSSSEIPYLADWRII